MKQIRIQKHRFEKVERNHRNTGWLKCEVNGRKEGEMTSIKVSWRIIAMTKQDQRMGLF